MLVDVHASGRVPGFDVWITIFETLAILNVEVESATYARVPSATFEVARRPELKAIKADNVRDRFLVEFVDSRGE